MPSSKSTDVDSYELQSLMEQFPEWKEDLPDIYQELRPPRLPKSRPKRGGTATGLSLQRRARTVPNTWYTSTYTPKNTRPRSTKKPPPSPRDPHPPRMTFDTHQRTAFTPKELGERTEPVKMEEQYQRATGPMDTKTEYQNVYEGHYKLPEIKQAQPARATLRVPAGKFANNTTNKEHYKQWMAEPTMCFGELPSFTYSILYPEKPAKTETTTKQTFKGMTGKPAELVKTVKGNISLEGDMNMETTNSRTYRSFPGAKPSQKIVYAPELSQIKRGKLEASTQHQRDFARRSLPPPVQPTEPAPSTIKLRFSDELQFNTEQREEYPGVDPAKHPIPKSFKPGGSEYKAPEVSFDTMTVNKRDFPEHDISSAYAPPVKPPTSKHTDLKQPFSDVTTNKDFFKVWKSAPRTRLGDFHEGHSYMPPVAPFEGYTTTGQTFRGLPGSVPPSFKPQAHVSAMDGKHDFNTVTSQTYCRPVMVRTLAPEQRRTLARYLREKKAAAQVDKLKSSEVKAKVTVTTES